MPVWSYTEELFPKSRFVGCCALPASDKIRYEPPSALLARFSPLYFGASLVRKNVLAIRQRRSPPKPSVNLVTTTRNHYRLKSYITLELNCSSTVLPLAR